MMMFTRRHVHGPGADISTDSDTGLKSSCQRARVDGQVHLVAHIHGGSPDNACAQLATRPSSSYEGGWRFLRRRPLFVHSDAASTTCLVTHMFGCCALDRGGVNCSVLVRAKTSTSFVCCVCECCGVTVFCAVDAVVVAEKNRRRRCGYGCGYGCRWKYRCR